MKFLYRILYYFFYFFDKSLFWSPYRDALSQRLCYRFLKSKLKWAYTNYPKDRPKVLLNSEDNVFIYWKQGFSNAPLLIKKTVSSIIYNCQEYNIVLLDETNILDYVSLPDYIYDLHDKHKISEAHFSDLLRLNLLNNHGGYWCDSTLFFTDRIPQYIRDTVFFMFTNRKDGVLSPVVCSNWFIKSYKENPLLCKLEKFLWTYYSYFDKPIHYFVFHLTLSALVNIDIDCQNIWNTMPYSNNVNPHDLSYLIKKNSKFNPAEYDSIRHNSSIHKLTRKFSKELFDDVNKNYLNYLLNNIETVF